MLRAAITPAHRGTGKKPQVEEGADKPATPRDVAMSRAQRLKRVFGIDIEVCARCGGKLKVIASITVPEQVQAELPLRAGAAPVQAGLL